MAETSPGKDLEIVLGMLSRVADEKRSGTLELRLADGGPLILELRDGKVLRVRREAADRWPLVLALYKARKIDAPTFNKAVAGAKEKDLAPERWLVDEGLLTEDVLDEARVFRDNEEILDALFARVVDARLHSPTARESRPQGEGFEPAALRTALEKRHEEWKPLRKYLPDDDDVPRPARVITDRIKKNALELDDLAQIIANRVDANQTVGELITTAPATLHRARCAIARGLKSGILERMPPRKLVKVAHAAETKRLLAKALRIYNLVRSRADHADRVDMHDVYIRTARIHETMGETQKACDLYVEQAHRLRDDGKLAGAANTLRRACRLAGEAAAPTLHARLVRWLVEDGEHAQAHDELIDLLSQGKPGSDKAAREVVECARMLLEVAPNDVEVEMALEKFEG